jgi:PAS domain S-box-containing protein
MPTSTRISSPHPRQSALVANEARLRLALEVSGTGCWSYDFGADGMTADARCKALFGLPSDIEPSLALFQQQLTPAGWALAQQRMEHLRAAPGEFEGEYQITWRDGTVHWVLIKGHSAPSAEGKPASLIGIAMDVTDRHQTEEALRESEARARAMLEAFDGLIYLCSPDYRIEFVNDRFVQRHGHDPTGEFCYRVLHDRDSACPWCPWPKLLDGGTVCWETPGSKDGRWYQVVNTLLRHADGRLSKQAMITDITDEKNAQAALRKSRDELEQRIGERTAVLDQMIKALQREVADRRLAQQSLLEARDEMQYLLAESPAVIYSAMPSGDYTTRFVSANVAKLLGFAPHAFLENDEFWRQHVHPDDLPAVLAQFPALLDEGNLACEYRFLHHNGTYRWMRDEMRLVRDAAGQPQDILGCWLDITDRKLAEEELLVSHALLQKRMEQLRAMATELTEAEQRERRRLAQALHDNLQQLLVASRLKAATLRRRVEEEELQQVLDEVDELLEQCVDESRSLTVELSPPVLHSEGLVAAVRWLSQWMHEKHDLHVELQCDDVVEPVDKEKRMILYQIVRELLFNCVKHAHVQHAELVMRSHEDVFELSVSDTGRGFDTGAKRPAGDSGFGLFSVAQRLEPLGGSVELDSAPGRGTRVTVRVPLLPLTL